MKHVLTLLMLILLYAESISQPSDFIVLKKNQQTIKSYYAGSEINFETTTGMYAGEITKVNKDSLFINQYDIRQVPTPIGVYVLDTVATYRLVFHYRQIIKIKNEERKGFNLAASGASLFGGGILLTVAGLATWVFTKPGTEYHAGPALIITSASLAGVGYLLMKSNRSLLTLGQKYQLDYIKVK